MPNGRKLPEGIASAALLWTVIGTLSSYSKLPAVIVTHFNIAGRVDGYGPKATILILPLVALGVYVLMTFIERLPPRMINTPFPLTDENRSRVLAVTYEMTSWINAWTQLIFVVLTTMTINVTTTGAAQSGEGMYLGGCIFLIAATVAFYIFRMYRVR